MWLADDDEIYGSSYISELSAILRKNPKVATSFANWKLIRSEDDMGTIQDGRDYKSNHWFLRTLKFVWYSHDDLFYGLHRSIFLRNATKTNFFLEKESIANWAYPYLLDMVIQGCIVQSKVEDVIWINHEYVTKEYPVISGKSKLKQYFQFSLRRFNVHFIYWLKISKNKGIIFLPVFISVSLISILKEQCLLITKAIYHAAGNRVLKNLGKSPK